MTHRTRQTLESHLAIALVHLEPPVHHLRALRLLNSLIASSERPDTSLIVAKAHVLQSSEKWQQAIEGWSAVLDSRPSEEIHNEALAERSWCQFNNGDLDSARQGFEQVLKSLEARKVLRDQQQHEKEKARSKAGLEKGEGVEEGETSVEATERASCWYRLGRCLWELGGEWRRISERLVHSLTFSFALNSFSYRLGPHWHCLRCLRKGHSRSQRLCAGVHSSRDLLPLSGGPRL